MKNNKFYHSVIKIEEHEFEKIFLEEINDELINLIKKFNSSKDVEYKKELAKQIPLDFPKCRFCGNIIINENFNILISQHNKYIKLR